MDFEKFFDSHSFEAMAREYNKKYNKTSMLAQNEKGESLRKSIKDAFSKAFCLFYMFERKMYGTHTIPRELSINLNQLRGDMKDYLKRNFDDENGIEFKKNNVISHKACMFAFLDMDRAFFDVFESLRRVYNLDTEIYLELKAIYNEILNLIKIFYVHI